MGLEHYIKDLLYRYNCVVIPGFGAFLTQEKSATIQESTNTFFPPTKTISFNQQLVSNDGLLVSYAAEVQKVSFEEMLKQVNEEVLLWKSKLQNGLHLRLTDIGTIWTGSEGKLQFEPSTSVNYLTSSFGMNSFVSSPVTREVIKEEVSHLEERTPIAFTPEKRERFSVQPYLKYAAVVLLAVTAGFTGYKYYQAQQENTLLAREEARVQVSKKIQEATFFDASPLELPAITLKTAKHSSASDLVKSHEKVHHIIAGAFRFRTNADKKIAQLKEEGYNPSYIGTNDFGLYMVSYDSFTDAEEALNALREIKQTQKDAWLKSIK